MNEIDKVVALLEDDAIEKRIAAAIVLGELRVKRAQDALVALLASEVPVLQRHALEALGKIGVPKKTIAKLFAYLVSNVADVRDAARAAIQRASAKRQSRSFASASPGPRRKSATRSKRSSASSVGKMHSPRF
jgi:HEAT repeat protein